MSIRKVANEIIIKAHQHIQRVYKESDIKFRMQIKPNIIILNISGVKVQFKKWKSSNLNCHIYSLAESHKEHATPLTYEILKEAIPFAYLYMEAIQKHEKLDGYVIARRPDANTNKELQEVILETDHSSFTDEERKYVACMFVTSLTYLYVAKIPCKLEEYIKKAVLTVKNIQEVLPNYPLCSTLTNPICLTMKYEWWLFYHGEEIVFGIIEKEHAIRITLKYLERTYKYNLPLEKEQIANLLDMIEEENRLKNLTQPETIFFQEFIDNNIRVNNVNELFEDLIGMIGDWEQVELIFQAINAKGINVELKSKESPFKELIPSGDSSFLQLKKSIIEDETDFRYNIAYYNLQYQSYCFNFIKHIDFNSFHANKYLYLGQVFVTSRDEESTEAKEYIQKLLTKADEMKNKQ
ncbi:hypothetical protein [Bacillus thuringiensis]|uniref:Uncharacterized protein n=1 Tax=Bacillus thuringiensis TaxID=1428 RepID=A0A9X6WJS8_BACTU|nr:hypothetical protein [Bacillus thuringiensis]PFJ33160.1 hypothetical protein COJ15_28370 [Bacillus thuringiensis]